MATARSAALSRTAIDDEDDSAFDALEAAEGLHSRSLHVLSAPAVGGGLGYRLRCLWSALRGSVGRHRLDIGLARPCVTTFDLGAGLVQRWRALMGGGAERAAARRAPLLCSDGATTLLQWQIFRDLGLDLRQVRQLSHRAQHPAGAAAVATEGPQQVRSELQGAWRVGDRQALLVLRGEVRAALRGGPGAVVAQTEDRFLVSGLPARDLATLPCDRELSRELISAAPGRRTPQVDPQASLVRLARIGLDPALAREYAALSGQLTQLHGAHRAQPMALRNLVAARLAAMGFALDHLHVQFERPAPLGQTLQLVCDGHVFELLDGGFQLVAWGRI
jgi:hypothetical protein